MIKLRPIAIHVHETDVAITPHRSMCVYVQLGKRKRMEQKNYTENKRDAASIPGTGSESPAGSVFGSAWDSPRK
jgi:hypothetical protein